MAESKLMETREKLNREEANIGLAKNGGKEARIEQRESRLTQTGLNLSYTKIIAPSDGYVTRKTAEVGNVIQPGQSVEFEVDTYPGRRFNGRVDSIMAGTGSAFALLPPENASGNFVKVVQRIPVKIAVISATDTESVLRAGMSVVPTIITGEGPGRKLFALNNPAK